MTTTSNRANIWRPLAPSSGGAGRGQKHRLFLKNVSRETFSRDVWPLFTDTEIPEYHVQDILHVDTAREASKPASSDSQLLSKQIFLPRQIGRKRPPQRRQSILKSTTVPRPRNQCRLTSSKKAFRLTAQSG